MGQKGLPARLEGDRTRRAGQREPPLFTEGAVNAAGISATKNKSPSSRIQLEGLHPVFLALAFTQSTVRRGDQVHVLGLPHRQPENFITKAGLLTPLPYQQPSHISGLLQWHLGR